MAAERQHSGSMTDSVARSKHHGATLDAQAHLPELLALFDAVRAVRDCSPRRLNQLAVKYVHENHMPVPQSAIIRAYEDLVAQGTIPFEHELHERLRLKPTRTISGVAPVA